MGLFALLTRFVPHFSRRSARPQFAASRLAPRRLERRRVFDGAAAGVMLEAIADVQLYVQTSESLIVTDQAVEQAQPAAAVAALPQATIRLRSAEIFEDQSVLAVIEITDSPPMPHQITIDWGDGSPLTVINVGPSVKETLAVHKFLDDNPSSTSSDTYTVTATVTNPLGGSDTAEAMILVKNVAPKIDSFSISSPAINENDSVTLSGTYSDVGTLDTHMLEIDWDDNGDFEQIVTVTGGNFSVTRQILDDDPTDTSSDSFNVNVRLRDDDGDADTESKQLTVNNLNPSVVLVSPTSIEENDFATLQGTITDVGTLDTFTLTIDWGDPFSPNNTQNFDLGTAPLTQAVDGINWDPVTRTFSLSHQYLDDNPSGTADDIYTISVTVMDDDLGIGMAETMLTVKNVGFTLALQPTDMIDENGFAELTGTINDPGTRDTFKLEINWGDPLSPDNTQFFILGATPLTEAADGIKWDPVTRTFTVRRQYLDDNPSATSGDNYTINVKVIGDDLSTDSKNASVLVNNVPPNIAFQPVATIDENGTAILEGHVDDPGTLDTFFIVIDWKDPLSPENTQSFALGIKTHTQAVDGINWDPITRIFSLSHQYLDDNPSLSTANVYPITVGIADDDTGIGLALAPVVVRNVNPVVTVDSVAQINEGGVASLTGSFTDVGTLDTHDVYVDWGDGSITFIKDVGINGAGSFAATHLYADNDIDSVINPLKPRDNLYTITVTVVDDDGGAHAPTTDITVLNVVPTLDPVAATDVSAQGFTTLTLTFADPGADSFQIMVDWGDNLHLQPQDRFELERVYSGPTPNTFVLPPHRYSGPPNPLNPSADIVISVVILDDDFGIANVADNGRSNIESVAISNPGIGAEPFRIDTTPQVPQLAFPLRVEPELLVDNANTNLALQQNVELRATSGETQATTDRFIELRVIDAEGNEGPGYRLRPEVLEDLPGLFRKLPDNHYVVYVVNMETNTRRLVIEVYVRNGKLIDPGDDSEGTRDRPPTEEQTIQPPAEQGAEAAEVEAGQAAAMRPSFDFPERELGLGRQRGFSRWSAVAVGLAASAASQSWVQRVDQALAQATTQQWRKLQGHNPPKRKNQ